MAWVGGYRARGILALAVESELSGSGSNDHLPLALRTVHIPKRRWADDLRHEKSLGMKVVGSPY